MRATVSSSLVGREADLDVLRDAYAEATAGSTRSVLIGGEAGIGKTRLVDEFLSGLPAEALGIDPDRLILAGDSAGAQIASQVAGLGSGSVWYQRRAVPWSRYATPKRTLAASVANSRS